MEFGTRFYCYGAFLAMLLISCTSTHAGKHSRRYSPVHHKQSQHRLVSSHPSNRARFFQKGTASWYGRRFHGHRTASGERYNMYALTAAHRTLPMSSYVRVTNMVNGKSVVVRINDRGPVSRRRVIDLSYAAATAIGLRRRGIGPVKIQRLARP